MPKIEYKKIVTYSEAELEEREAKRLEKRNNLEADQKAILDRNDDIFRMYQRDYTLQAIGDKHGLTRERVRQIIKSMDLQPRLQLHHDRIETAKTNLRKLAEQYKQDKKILSIANVVEALGVTEYIARRLFRETGLHIEFPRRFTQMEIYRAALKVKSGSSIHKAANGDNYFANLIGQYCKAHNIPVRYSRWQDMSQRKEIIIQGRTNGLSWREITEQVSKAENRKISTPAVYHWAKTVGLDKIEAKKKVLD